MTLFGLAATTFERTGPANLFATLGKQQKINPKYNRTQMTQMIMITTDKAMKNLR